MSRRKRKLSDRPSNVRVRGNRALPALALSSNARDQKLLKAIGALQQGDFQGAAALCRLIIEREPEFIPALQLSGMIASRAGQTERAIAILRRVIALDENAIEARNELGSLLRADKQFAEAISLFQRVVLLKEDDAGAHNNLGLCYIAIGQLSEAAESFQRAIALDSSVVVFYENLAMTLQSQGRFAESVIAFRRALMVAPNVLSVRIRLGRALHIQGERAEAYEHFRKLIEMPMSLQAGLQLSSVLLEVRELALAERALRVALKSDGMSVDAHEMLGSVLQQLGRFADAIGIYERLIALKSNHGGAYFGIVSSKVITEKDRPLIGSMTSMLSKRGLAEHDRVSLHYALGKAFDQLGEYGNAMMHFESANRIASNRLKVSGHMINRSRHAANIDRLISTFTCGFFKRNAAVGCGSELPVLIVGMIRSGTTLLERILSNHPKVGAGGELRFWGEKGPILGEITGGQLGDLVTSIAEDYRRLLCRIAPQAERVTDKMPLNFLMLGLVHLVFPRARIIHCRRNAIDTCLSIFTTPYTNLPDFAHSRSNIAFYYEEYRRVMAHWRLVLPPDRFLEIDYEDLVTDPERMTRHILTFCGLDWEEACLRPDKNQNAVSTPSLWQVRQPIYKNAVERWRNYEPWLGDFRRLTPKS